MAEDRRTVLKVLTSVLSTGAAAALVGPALKAAFSPLGTVTVSGSGELVPVCPVEAVPEDGTPIRVAVIIQEPKDAWVKMPPTNAGSVFLKKEAGELQAFSTVCPHLGCGIDYSASTKMFGCPCHDTAFHPTGAVEHGPSPRPMDRLDTEVKDGVIHVRFLKFKLGTAEKVPV